MSNTYSFDTLKLHAGYNPAEHNHAVSVPIYQTTAFTLDTVKRSDDLFYFDSADALYTRLSNPTSGRNGGCHAFFWHGGGKLFAFERDGRKRKDPCYGTFLRRLLR